MDGAIYEPRSFWSIANVASTSAAQRVGVDKRHFMNGERWPITINRLALAAINYTLRGPGGATHLYESSEILNRIAVRFSVPQRYHVNPTRLANLNGLPARSSGQHPTVGAASLYGQCHLDFDKSLMLPKDGSIEWDLSAHTAGVPAGGQTPPVENTPTYCEMAYVETGGLMGGDYRARTVQLGVYIGDMVPGIEDWPYSPDGFGGGLGAPPALISRNWWPPTSRFPAGGGAPDWLGQRNTTFNAQEATRSGSTEITGLRTVIEQRAYDAHVLSVLNPLTGPVAPLSMRTGCRIRCTNGGSAGHYWWRPGAPLCLVLDTITPASVVMLQEPVTLGPGEQLDIELEVPAEITNQHTTYRIGVAFNGYAEIEG